MDRADTIRTAAIIFLIFTWSTLFVRCWVRLKMIKSFGRDDAFMILAQLIFTVLAAVGYRNTYHGIGTHIYESTPEYISNALELLFLDELLYSLNVTATKISITLFLFRILNRKIHKTILYIALTIGCLYTTAFFLSILFQCRPIAKYWNPMLKGSCVDPKVTVGFAYGYSAINISTDLTLAIVPIFIVRELQMNQRTKIGVTIILALGTIASVATVVRIPYIRLLATTHDFLYEMYGIVLWSLIEPAVGIVAANLATFRPLLQAASRMKSTLNASKKSSSSPSAGVSKRSGGAHSKPSARNVSDASTKVCTDLDLNSSNELDVEKSPRDGYSDRNDNRSSDGEYGPTDSRW